MDVFTLIFVLFLVYFIAKVIYIARSKKMSQLYKRIAFGLYGVIITTLLIILLFF